MERDIPEAGSERGCESSMQVGDWLSKDGFLSFYNKLHTDHGKPFADSVDHTALWLTGELFAGNVHQHLIRDILTRGLGSREFDGGWLRYPGSNETLKHDQIKSLVPLLRHVGMRDTADKMVELYGGKMFPHQADHLRGLYTPIGDFFEGIDSISDWFSDSESSQVKNIVRIQWRMHLGAPYKTAKRLFTFKVTPEKAMIIYGARRPETQPHEYHAILVRALHGLVTINDPPPIYRPWLDVFRRNW